MSDINSLLSRLDKVKKIREGEWSALCPVHNEKTPSMRIKHTQDDKILMHCFGCGANGTEIVQAIGLDTSDLFPEGQHYKGKHERIYFSPGAILSTLKFESTIIALAANDIAQGKALSLDDAKRVELARERIEEALVFCDK